MRLILLPLVFIILLLNVPARPQGIPEPSKQVDLVRIHILRAGVYYVTGEQLRRFRPDLENLDPSRLVMKYYARPWPIHLENLSATGRLQDATRLVFYLDMELPVPYVNVIADDVHVANFLQLFLQGDRVEALRFRPPFRETVPVPDRRNMRSVLQRIRMEQNLLWEYFEPPAGRSFEINTDFRFWAKLARPATSENEPKYSFNIALDDADPSGPNGHVRAFMWGVTSFGSPSDHSARLLLNGQELARATWDGVAPVVLEAVVPARLFVSGANRFDLELLEPDHPNGPPFDVVLLDWLELSYPRRPKPQRDYVIFSSSEPSPHSVTIDGFSSSELTAFDVGRSRLLDVRKERTAPLFISHSATVTLDGPTSAVVLYSQRSPLAPTIYLEGEQWLNIRNMNVQCDYLMVAPKRFIQELEPLVTFRSNEGIAVQVVPAEAIYQEFGGGFPGAEPIKDFVRFARENWGRPRYLLLVGDACAVSAIKTWLPTRSFNTLGGSHASDQWFAMIEDDETFPNMAVGRISATEPAHVSTAVSKIIERERFVQGGQWRNEALFIVATTNWAYRSAYNIVQSRLFPWFQWLLLRTDQKANSLEAHQQLTDDITRSLNEGRLFTVFFGHGGGTVWEVGPSYNEDFFKAHLFDQTNIQSLRNVDRQTLVLALTCFTNDFDHPHFPVTIGESFQRSEGGAFAVVGTSGTTDDNTSVRFAREFFRLAIGERMDRLGDVILETLRLIEDDNMTRHLVLLGDPASRIMLPKRILSLRDPDNTTFDLTVLRDGVRVMGRLEGSIHTGAGVGTFSDFAGVVHERFDIRVQDGMINERITLPTRSEEAINWPMALSIYVHDERHGVDWHGSVAIQKPL